MKTCLKLIIFFFLFTNCAYAYCDLEIIKMESGVGALASKTNFVLAVDNMPNAPFTFPIPSEEICSDSKFKMFPVNYTFINKNLHQIFIEDMLSNINHLENLTYYYGKPTEEYKDVGSSGMKFYHWELSSKHVFLVIKFSPGEIIQNIEIVSNKYPQLIEKYNAELEE